MIANQILCICNFELWTAFWNELWIANCVPKTDSRHHSSRYFHKIKGTNKDLASLRACVRGNALDKVLYGDKIASRRIQLAGHYFRHRAQRTTIVLWKPTHACRGRPKASYIDTLKRDTGASDTADLASLMADRTIWRNRVGEGGREWLYIIYIGVTYSFFSLYMLIKIQIPVIWHAWKPASPISENVDARKQYRCEMRVVWHIWMVWKFPPRHTLIHHPITCMYVCMYVCM
jgi:hypothetical protein